jgi:branched-chain amino acid transport system ATP-binding protein
VTDTDSPVVLEAANLSAGYGPIQALDDVAVVLREGEIVTLVGPNGAGKTTLLNVLSGSMKCRNGTVSYRGRDVTRTPAHKRVALGISHVPERRQLFGPLSVIDNLLLGGYVRARRDGRQALNDQMKIVYELFPVLADRRMQRAATLSGGEQQMLALGRGLMARPAVIMLDEPSLGLAPQLARDIFDAISRLPELGTAILLVEQNARMALRVAERGYVMETGRIVLDGSAAQLKTHPRVQEAYLGRLRAEDGPPGDVPATVAGNGSVDGCKEEAPCLEPHET